MNQLTIINQNGQLLVDSREIAEMVEKRHSDLIRDIEGYKDILDQNADLRSDQFFTGGRYTAGTGKSYKCFLLTKKGCDMVANKMTGEKGVLFTATYVTRFEEMEKQINRPQTQLEVLQSSIAQLVEQERRLSAVEKRQDQITEVLSLNPTEWRKKANALINKIAQQYGGHGAYLDVRNESYQILEDRAGCKLSIRLTNKQRKMALEGVQKSKIDKANKMDVIADDARLTEIYLAIVKEMAINNQVDAKEVDV